MRISVTIPFRIGEVKSAEANMRKVAKIELVEVNGREAVYRVLFDTLVTYGVKEEILKMLQEKAKERFESVKIEVV